MFTSIKNLPKDTLGFKIQGKTSKEDYVPLNLAMAEHEKENKKIKILTEIDDLDYTPGAFFEDFKFGLKHYKNIKAMAIISDKKWIDNGIDILGKLMPHIEAKGFEKHDYMGALNWLEKQ